MRWLKEIAGFISCIGIDDHMDDRLARKVKLTNQLTAVAFSMTFVQLLAFPQIEGYPLICCISMLLYAITWALNEKKLWNASRLYFCITCCILICISGSLVSEGNNISFKFMFLQAFVCPLVVFDIKEPKYLTFGFVAFVATFIAFDSINSSIAPLPGIDLAMFDNPMSIMMNGIMCMVSLFLGYRYLQKLNYEAEDKLAESISIEQEQRELIEAKNKDIQDGIAYAKQIQQAVLPKTEDIRACIPDHFIMYQPKEKIGGDFFWYGEYGRHIVFAAVDCTGHGTPGALISIIGSKLLDKIVKEQGVTSPKDILELLNLDIISTLSSEYKVLKDGMDISLVSIDTEERVMRFAGAKNNLIHIRKGEIREIRGDRASIGEHHILDRGFIEKEVPLQKGDSIYMHSDGIVDQFGGQDGRKWMRRPFQQVLGKNSEYSMDLQADCLDKEFARWKQDEEQIDDILVIGFRVDFDHISNINRFRNGSPSSSPSPFSPRKSAFG